MALSQDVDSAEPKRGFGEVATFSCARFTIRLRFDNHILAAKCLLQTHMLSVRFYFCRILFKHCIHIFHNDLSFGYFMKSSLDSFDDNSSIGMTNSNTTFFL